MFAGNTFAATKEAMQGVVENEPSFDSLAITNSYTDKLYGALALLNEDTADKWVIPDGWKFGTMFNAQFNKDLSGGNISYSTESVKGIKIKRKLPNEENWKTIWYNTNVKSSKDFELLDAAGNQLVDYLEPNNVDVQYMYVPVFRVGTEATHDIDLNSQVVTVHSRFESDMLIGERPDEVMVGYPARFNETLAWNKNRNAATVVTLGSKYPFVINNGDANYYSGQLDGLFILMDENCKLDTEEINKYRMNLDDFLSNGLAKIIKTNEGDMFMVAIDNTITHQDNGTFIDTDNNHWVKLMNTQFSWSEIGDAYDVGDLYDNNFINTDVDRGA